MPPCSYCRQSASSDLLLCCLTLSCNGCSTKHPCACMDSIPLELKHPTLKNCRRCNVTVITHKCITCKKFYCKECNSLIHQGKYRKHETIQITHLKKDSNDVVCVKHQLKRNIVMENGNIGCIRCSQESGIKKVAIVDQSHKIQPSSILLQLIQQKKISLSYDKKQVFQKWQAIQTNINSLFNKLIFQLQERQKLTLEKINTIKFQQTTILDDLQKKLEIQKSSLEGLYQINVNNKQKLLKIKHISVEQTLKYAEKKKRLSEYHIGRMQIDSLISAIRGLVNIQKIKQKQQYTTQRKKNDIFESNRKDRRSQSRDMSKSRISQVIPQSGMKTRQNSFSRLPAPINLQKKLTQSIVLVQQKSRLKSQTVSNYETAEDLKKSENFGQKYKSNFLQMKENIRKSGTYINQRTSRR